MCRWCATLARSRTPLKDTLPPEFPPPASRIDALIIADWWEDAGDQDAADVWRGLAYGNDAYRIGSNRNPQWVVRELNAQPYLMPLECMT